MPSGFFFFGLLIYSKQDSRLLFTINYGINYGKNYRLSVKKKFNAKLMANL